MKLTVRSVWRALRQMGGQKAKADRAYGIIYLPKNRRPSIDPATRFFEMSEDYSKSLGQVAHIEQPWLILDSHFEANDPMPDKLAIFGHCGIDGSGYHALNSSELDSRYWRLRNPYKLVYSHSCWGFTMLSKPEWTQIMPNCVTYVNELHCCFGSPATDKFWKGVSNNLVLIVSEAETTESLYLLVKEFLDDEFDRQVALSGRGFGNALNVLMLGELRYGLTVMGGAS